MSSNFTAISPQAMPAPIVPGSQPGADQSTGDAFATLMGFAANAGAPEGMVLKSAFAAEPAPQRAVGDAQPDLAAYRAMLGQLAGLVPGTSDTSAENFAENPGDLTLATLPAFETETTDAVEADGDKTDPADLLAGIIDALSALQQVLARGETPDPALTQQVNDGLEALAQLMGMPVNSFGPEGGDGAELSARLAALLGTAPAGSGGDAAVAAPPANELDALTQKLADLAKALGASETELSARLKTLAENLQAARANAEVLTKLGFDAALNLTSGDADAALATLLDGKAPEKPVAPAQPFAAPTLDTPEVLAPVKAEAKPEEPVLEEPEIVLRTTPATARPETDKPAAEPMRQRADTAAPTLAQADAAADPAPTAPPTNTGIVPAARTELAPGLRAVQAAYQSPHTQVNIPQMAFEIVRHVADGHNRFQIRLDPAELGRIDVRMEIDTKGTLNARLTVERAETLDLLQRDQRALEKALSQAGLDSSKTNLEFSLKQNPFARQDQGSRNEPGFDFGGSGSSDSGEGEPVTTIATSLYRGSASASGVNLFV